MTEVEMATVSSRGQVAISADVRREMEIDEGTNLLVVSEGRQHTPPEGGRIHGGRLVRGYPKAMWKNAEEEGLKEEDVERLIHESRFEE